MNTEKKKTVNKNIEKIYSLTPMQEGMLFYRMQNSESSDYFLQNTIEMEGSLQIDYVKKSLKYLMLKYDVLRTLIFYKKSSSPKQVVLADREIEMNLIDLSFNNEDDCDEKIQNIKNADIKRGFDLEIDTLIRVTIIKTAENKHTFLWSAHHIIMDGWCISLLFNDFLSYYDMLCKNTSDSQMLQQVKIEKNSTASYGDYIKWLEQQDIQRGISYWKELLRGYQNAAEISPLKEASATDKQVNIEQVVITGNELDSLKKMASDSNVTVSTVVETSWGLLLQQYNMTDDVVFGKVVSGRNADISNIETAVGLFINTIPSRVTSNKNDTYVEILKQTQKQSVEGESYHYCSLADIQSQTPLGKELIKTLFVFENFYVDKNNQIKSDELEVAIKDSREQTNYSLTLICEMDEGLSLKMMYNPNEYSTEEIMCILKHLKNLINDMTYAPNKEFAEAELISDEEKRLILTEFNKPYSGYSTDKTIAELFELQVDKTPDLTAVTYKNEHLTYNELNKKSNKLAARLRSIGIGSNDLVVICTNRNLEMIVGIYAIVKAGAAYVPVDPMYPSDRIEYIVNDSSPKAVILGDVELSFDIDAPIIDMYQEESYIGDGNNLPNINKPSDILYVIYTSGTTGNPKGVMITHENVVRLMKPEGFQFDFNRNDVWTMFHSFGFDFSVWEMYGATLFGGRLIVVSKETAIDSYEMLKLINDEKVTVLNQVPSSFYNLMNADNETESSMMKSVRYLIFGGEALKPKKLKEWYLRNNQVKIINMYGITETTVHVTYREIGMQEINNGVSDIGTAIPTLAVYIMNGMNLCGVGMRGELCVAGAGLAKGYLNRDDLTDEKFVPNPFGNGRLYRSGDAARWRNDGNLEYIGRIDHQVKIRGFRVELGEIESAIRKVNGIKDVVVVIKSKSDDEKYICAYYIADEEIEIDNIKNEISKILPTYMIPAFFTRIDSIPTTRNGKLDIHALPEIKYYSSKEYVAPRNHREIIVAQAFKDILGIEEISVKDNFFEIGGDSIKAIRIVSKIRAAGFELKIADLMEKQTIEAIAGKLKKIDSANQISQSLVTGEVYLAPIQREFFQWNFDNPNYFFQSMMLKNNQGFEKIAVKEALNAIIKHHDSLRTVFKDGKQEIFNLEHVGDAELIYHDFTENNDPKNLNEKIQKKIMEIQKSINIDKAPIIKAGLFKTNYGDHLMICVHHLVIDGVSWRILIEDFRDAYTQFSNSGVINMQRKTHSYKDWSAALKEYGQSYQLNRQRPYWEKTAGSISDGKVFAQKINEQLYEHTEFILDEITSRNIAVNAGNICGNSVVDVLLASLTDTVCELYGNEYLSVQLEGHGREKIHKEMIIDRTIGWFTSMYPVVIEKCSSKHEQLIKIKELLKSVPNNGIGYGVLAEQMADINAIKPDICFNYLGDLDREINSVNDIQISDISCELGIGDQNVPPYPININVIMVNKKLSIRIAYNTAIIKTDELNKLIDSYKKQIDKYILVCMDAEKRIKTASDYDLFNFSNNELTEIIEKYEEENVEDIFKLTQMQEGMLYHRLLDDKSTGYFIQDTIEIEGELNVEYLKDSLKILAQKYDVLRTAIFYNKISQPLQIILKNREIEFEIKDLSENKKDNKIEEICQMDIERGFDLENDSLLRVKVIMLSENKYLMIWSFHHIIMDGWCNSIVFKNFMRYYAMLSNGSSGQEVLGTVLNERSEIASYKDYSKWLDEQDKQTSLKYWCDMLDGYEEEALIPSSGKPVNLSNGTSELIINWGSEIIDLLEETSKKANVTVNTILEASWGILLQRYNNSRDVVFGKVVSGRNADVEGIEKAVGLFINSIPVRVKCGENTSCSELLKEMQEQANASSSHDYCGIAEIQNSMSESVNLINTLFVYENYYVDEEFSIENSKSQNITIKPKSFREETNYPITVSLFLNDGLNCKIMYDSSMYAKEQIQRLISQIRIILNDMIDKPGKLVCSIECLCDEEKNKVLNVFNDTDTDYYANLNMSKMLEMQAKLHPDNTSIVLCGEKYTYDELNRKINIIANSFREIGIGPNDYVAVVTEKSLDTIVAICSVIKAGAAYVPIDSKYPEERIKYIINDCKPGVIISNIAIDYTGCKLMTMIEMMELEGNEDNPENISTSDDAAYIIYTSGTTGRPKGSVIEQKGVMRLVKNTNFVPMNEKTIILQAGSMSFDASTFEIWGALLNGGELHISTDLIMNDAAELKKYLIKENINTMFLTTSLFNYMIDTDSTLFSSLEYMITGGERISEKHSEIFKNNNRNTQLINGYGPTETTTFAATYRVEDEFDDIPIGKPIFNTKIYIIDKDSNLCGIGMLGELCIAGPGVARGYLNMKELTDSKFVDNPYGEGKMYKSGDIASWNNDGNIRYIGRIDSQVKIRGYRIELSGVERAIQSIESVCNATTVVRNDKKGNKAIHAYYVADKIISASEIRERLLDKLPNYMIPALMMQIEKIPLTSNGKINRKALPSIRAASDVKYVAPETDEEKAIIYAFNKVLEESKIGMNDNFYSLGGDSLKAIKIISLIKEKGYEYSIRQLIQYQTPAMMIKNHNSLVTKSLDEDIRDIEITKCVDVNGALDTVQKIIDEYNKKILLGKCIKKMNLSAVQHLSYDLGIKSVFLSIPLPSEFGLSSIEKAWNALIKRHGVLRSSVIVSQQKNIMSEYGVDDYIHIPAIDVSEIDEESTCKLIRKVIKFMDIYASNESYTGTNAACSVLYIREGENKSRLMLSASHLAIDGYSAELLLGELKSIIYGGDVENYESVMSYKECVESIETSANEIDYASVTKALKINEFIQLSNEIQKNNLDNEIIKYEFEFKIPCITNSDEKFELSEKIYLYALQLCYKVEKMPIFVVHSGRVYKDYDFTNCLGEFLDIVPVIADISKTTTLSDSITRNLQYVRENNVNFASLIYEGENNGYNLASKLLGENEITDMKIPIFNYVGIYSDTNDAMLTSDEINSLDVTNKALITDVRFTDDKLIMTLFDSSDNIDDNKKLLYKYADTLFKEINKSQ